MRSMVGAVVGTAIVVLAVGSAVAQRTAGTMMIDFLATGGDGQPIPQLAPSDITFKAGGRDLTVHSVELITLDAKDAPAAAAAETRSAARGIPPAFGVTRPVTPRRGRNVVLLLDEGTLFSVEKIVKDSVRRLIDSLAPEDRLGLISTRPGGASVELTSTHDAVRNAIDTLVYGRGNAALCVGALIDQVRTLAEALPRGRATTLALISRGSGTAPTSVGPLVSGAGNCTFRREELPPVEQAVSAAQINYHVFHVGGSGLSANLDNFAGATGAETGILSWTDAEGLARMISASSRFFRATVDAPAAARDDYQRVEFRVRRPDVKVRGPQYVRNERSVTPVADAGALLRGNVFRADLPLRVAAFTSRNAGPQPYKLVVVVEPADAKPLLSVVVSVVGSDGEVAGQWTARRADLARSPLVTAVPVNEGAYRVRAAAVDEDGRGGVAEYLVNAALEGSGPVKMSDIAIGISTAGSFSPRLQFGGEAEAIAYLEVYDVPAAGRVSVTFEAAATADGRPISTVPGQVSGSSSPRIVTARLPLADLPVGDTFIRARVTVDDQLAGTVLRMLRKVS